MSDVERQIELWLAALNGSELLSSADVIELEAHLREEMEHLKSAGLSDEEAFLVARRRLGDTAALEGEFAKVSPHRHLSTRLSWMAAGVLSYLLLMHLSLLATSVSTLLGHSIGLRNLPLALFAWSVQVAVFATLGGIATLVWWHWASRRPARTERIAPILSTGLAVAGTTAALWWIGVFGRAALVRIVGMRDTADIARAQYLAAIGWAMLLPFALVGLIALLALRTRRPQMQ